MALSFTANELNNKRKVGHACNSPFNSGKVTGMFPYLAGKMNGLMWICLLLKGGSINYHRKVFFMSVFLRFVILWPLFGSIYLFVQSYSSLYSFTHK